MSWSQKKSKLSGNVIIDGTIEGDQLADDTVTFAKLNGVKDEDDFASNSDTALATQQSIKAYVDELLDKKETQYGAAHDSLNKSLSTSFQTIHTTYKTLPYTEKRLQTAKFQVAMQSGSSTYRNDTQLYITVTKPSTTTAYSIGTATYLSNPFQYVHRITFDGDITDKLTIGGSIGLNLDSSGQFGDRGVRGFYYQQSSDYTVVEYSSYPSAIVSSGSPVEVFFDPFHWLSAGADVNVELHNIDLPYSQQQGVFTIEARLGYFSQSTSYKLRGKELNSGDVVTINKLDHTLKVRKL
jgi:hypothetical protein